MQHRDIDALATFETAGALLSTHVPTRYAVRQVLDQELQRTLIMRDNAARQARLRAGGVGGSNTFIFDDDKENRPRHPRDKDRNKTNSKSNGNTSSLLADGNVKKDFFGRIIVDTPNPLAELDGNGNARRKRGGAEKERCKVWVTYNEGLNNAVKKPISLEEFLRGF